MTDLERHRPMLEIFWRENAIWEQKENSAFYELKDLLLNYLEKLGFIAKPQQLPDVTDDTDYYFAPCVLKHPPPDDLLIQQDNTDNRSTSKLCLTTELRFLPTAVFNKLLAACINKWPLSKSNSKHLIFCGCAVFDLEGNHTLYLYFFDHVIQIWITKFSTQNEEPSKRLCSQVYAFVLDTLANSLHLSDHLKVFFKCRSSQHNSNEDMFSEDELSEDKEVVCNCRTKKHVLQTNELTSYWHCTEEDPSEEMLTDKDIHRIAQNIGKEYETLALELGLSQAEMDHISLDSNTAIDRIRRMLLRWRDKMKGEATLDTLTEAMKAVGIDSSTV
ncbi:uncharacterized protein LOC132757656 [Ruditapes philippinarum]|uniref:uncharacterized protein LOC132757656 n=1 Tax=Ruditapes philippinarum TaxID=129788 RepID=UPI00295B24F5|nr:uncharacterized protein LOC132757656 [Ruditapes philippinarum]